MQGNPPDARWHLDSVQIGIELLEAFQGLKQRNMPVTEYLEQAAQDEAKDQNLR